MSAAPSSPYGTWLFAHSPNTNSTTGLTAQPGSPDNSRASLARSRVNSFSTTETIPAPTHPSKAITGGVVHTTATTRATSGGSSVEGAATRAVHRDPTQTTSMLDTRATPMGARQQGDGKRASCTTVPYCSPVERLPRLHAVPSQQPQPPSQQQQQQQQQQVIPAAPQQDRGHSTPSVVREPVPCVVGVSDICFPKTNIYQLRGLSFATTVEDVKALLESVPEYKQLDVGFFETRECSGNAFVELYDETYKDNLMALNNRRIVVPGEYRRTADGRKRERYLEVFAADAGRRESVLYNDAHSTPRRGGQRQQRPTGPTANTAAVGVAMMHAPMDPITTPLSFAPTRQVFFVEQPQQPQPQPQAQPQPQPQPQPQRPREGGWWYVGRPSPLTLQESRPVLVTSSTSSPSRFSANSSVYHSQEGSWPTFLLPSPPQHQQQQQQHQHQHQHQHQQQQQQQQLSSPGPYYHPQPAPHQQQPSYAPASTHPTLLRLPSSLVGEPANQPVLRQHEGSRGPTAATSLSLFQIVTPYAVQQQQQHPHPQPTSPPLSLSQSQSQHSLYSVGDGSYVLLAAPAAPAPAQPGYYVAAPQQATFYYPGCGPAS